MAEGWCSHSRSQAAALSGPASPDAVCVQNEFFYEFELYKDSLFENKCLFFILIRSHDLLSHISQSMLLHAYHACFAARFGARRHAQSRMRLAVSRVLRRCWQSGRGTSPWDRPKNCGRSFIAIGRSDDPKSHAFPSRI